MIEPVAVELQSRFRVSLPASIKNLIADVAYIVSIRGEVVIQNRHFPIGCIAIALDDVA